MNEPPFYASRSTVGTCNTGVPPGDRRGAIAGPGWAGATIELGVHGAIKSHYRLGDQPDLPCGRPGDGRLIGEMLWTATRSRLTSGEDVAVGSCILAEEVRAFVVGW